MDKMNKIYKFFLYFLIVIITCFPKINIFNFPDSRLGIRLDDLLVLVFFIIIFIKIIKNGMKKYSKFSNIFNIFIVCFTFFFISNIINVIIGNVDLLKSMLYLFRKLEYFVLIFAGYDLVKTNNNDSKKIIKIFKFILLFHFIYMTLELFNIVPDIGFLIGRAGNDRIYSTFSGPYEFAGFLSILLPLFLYGLIYEKKIKNIFFIVLILIGIILSESRISLLAVIISIIIFIISKYLNKKNVLKLGLSLVFSIISLLFIINNSNIKSFNRIKDIDFKSYVSTFEKAWDSADFEYYVKKENVKYNKNVLNSTKDLSYAIRVSKWTTILKETRKSPFIGLGHSICGEAMDGSLVRILCEAGLIGLFLWIYLLWVLYKIARQHSNKCKIIVLNIIIILLITSCFIDIFEASKVMMTFWLLVGFLLFQKKDKQKIKILHVVSGVNFGGVETVIYNYFSNMKNKYDNIIVSHNKINIENKKLFEELNFKFYEVTPKKKNIIKNFIQLYKIINKEKPDIVQVHMTLSSYMALFAAYLNGVGVRICHVHENSKNSCIINKVLCNLFANNYFACSKTAGELAFFNNKEVIIINNAINLNKYDFNIKVRNKVRNNLNISNSFVIGNVGRFVEEKNHKRIIEIFSDMLKKYNNIDFKLLLIGEGKLKNDIKTLVKKNNLENNIIFIDSTNSIEQYYQAMDVFIFPSLREGLGIVAVEAQVSGLPCIVSNNVPSEVKVSNLVKFISLDNSNDIWCNEIIKYNGYLRKSRLEKIKNTGFDIKNEAKKLDKLYNILINDL